MKVIQPNEADGNARTVRAAEGQVQFGREPPDHVFEILAVDQHRFAALETGIQHATVFTSAEITQNRNMKRQVRFARLYPLAAFTGMGVPLLLQRYRNWPPKSSLIPKRDSALGSGDWLHCP